MLSEEQQWMKSIKSDKLIKFKRTERGNVLSACSTKYVCNSILLLLCLEGVK